MAVVVAAWVWSFAVMGQVTHSSDDANAPTHIQSGQMTGRPDREVFLERDVDITRGDSNFRADKATYWIAEDEIEASGNVKMTRFGDFYTGDRLRYKMDARVGYVENPTYHILTNNGQGQAKRIDFESDDRALVSKGTYSTCEGPDPDWYLRANTMTLDRGRDIGTASATLLYFKGIPVLGMPYVSFSLSGARKSGVLPPSIGTSSRSGLEIVVPYYFNIAPNRDFTLSPRLVAKRGVQIGGEARYLGHQYKGETRFEYLGNDREAKINRYLVSTVHNQNLTPRSSLQWDINVASDDNYSRDFSRDLAASTNRLLLRRLYFGHAGDFWHASIQAANYQVLQDPLSPIGRPYDRLPQVSFTTGRSDVGGFDWTADAEISRFDHPDHNLWRGARYVVNPGMTYPVVRPGYFIKPKLSLHATAYNVEKSGLREHFQRVVPTFSLDGGLIFERDARFLGEMMTQTLEPRLFYVKTPYRNQGMLPNFDSFETDLSFAQIFSENRFIGHDRISDAHQITAALVSRFIENNGKERMRFAVAQRYYFDVPKVVVSGVPGTDKKSDILVAANLQFSDTLSTEGALRYSATQRSVSRANYGLTWRPAPKKVLNLAYRRDRPNRLSQVDISGQWPLSRRWYGIGRINYSLTDDALISNNKTGNKISEGLLGLEYKASCWVFRVVAQRLPTGTAKSNTSLFFQIELGGLTKIGSDPMKAIHNNIPGYQAIDPLSR